MADLNSTGVSSHLAHPTWAVTSVKWLVTLRWFAGLAVLVGTAGFGLFLELALSAKPLYVIGAAILAYNTLLWLRLRQLGGRGEETSDESYKALAHLQMGLDWVAMAVLIRYTGGIESPLIFFFLFHVLISALLFRRAVAYAYTLTAVALVGGIAALEWAGLLTHVHMKEFFAWEAYRSPVFVVGVFGSFSATSLITVYLASSIAERLRRHREQIKTLYMVAGAINSSLDLQQVLDTLVRATTEAMNVTATSIGLLDNTGSELRLVASHGLSQEYLTKGPILVSKSRVYRTVLETSKPLILQGDVDPGWFQYPEEKKQEGVHSILYVPLEARDRLLGVVRVHSRRPLRFRGDDARFLSAIASQGAVAIQNAMAYQTLKKLDVVKSQFVRSVTHELRAPVHGAQSLLRAVLSTSAEDLTEKQQEIIERMNGRMDKLEELINDLLDLSKGRADLDTAECRPTPLSPSMHKVVAAMRPQAQEKNVSIFFEGPPEDPIVVATEEGIERIFSNLLGNAVKYTPEGGSVSVWFQVHERLIEIAVEDTGIGIPTDSLSSLFQEFYRAANAKEFGTGTGLGLVIVKELVEKCGGRISVESEVGGGTTFTVHLPRAPVEEAAPAKVGTTT